MWDSIDWYNCKEFTIKSSNYQFIPRLSKAKIRWIKDNSILDTSVANNQHNNSPNNLPTKKNLFKDAVQHPSFNSFMLIHYHLLLDKESTGLNSAGKQGTYTRSLIRWKENFTIAANNNNALAIRIAVNKLIKVIHSIKGDNIKIKIYRGKANNST